ncbi:MAG: C39 family peptidase [Thermomicrobiales bacterium]
MQTLSRLRLVTSAAIATFVACLVAATGLAIAAPSPVELRAVRAISAISRVVWLGDAEPAAVKLPGVFTYQQQRSLSCEYASLHIATGLLGDPVSEYAFDDVVPHNENPHLGYRGNITGIWGNTDDYGVYAEPLAHALPHVGFTGDAFYGGRAELEAHLDRGRPVVVWLGMWGDAGGFDAYSADGARYQLTTGMHVMVAYGYDAGGVYLTDPGTAVLRYYNWVTYLGMWDVMDGMALSVYR